jgi:hypothetical protein
MYPVKSVWRLLLGGKKKEGNQEREREVVGKGSERGMVRENKRG